MRAKPLLEALADLKEQPADGAINRVIQYRDSVERLIAFYSLPFSPSLLTGDEAVFAGWYVVEEMTTKNNWYFWDGFNERILIQNFQGRDIWSFKFDNGLGKLFQVPYPKNIGQFIEWLLSHDMTIDLTPQGEKLWRGEA